MADGSLINGFRTNRRKFKRHVEYLEKIGIRMTHRRGQQFLDVAKWCKKTGAARLNHHPTKERDPKRRVRTAVFYTVPTEAQARVILSEPMSLMNVWFVKIAQGKETCSQNWRNFLKWLSWHFSEDLSDLSLMCGHFIAWAQNFFEN